MSGSNIGAKTICGVVDQSTMDALPLLAVDNFDGTAILKIILCGTQSDGTITPLKCDASGQLITKAGV
jgi:hypothetical protein